MFTFGIVVALFSIQHPCYFMENKVHFVPLICQHKQQYMYLWLNLTKAGFHICIKTLSTIAQYLYTLRSTSDKLPKLLFCGLFLMLVSFSQVFGWSSSHLDKQTASCKLPDDWLVRWCHLVIFSVDWAFVSHFVAFHHPLASIPI